MTIIPKQTVSPRKDALNDIRERKAQIRNELQQCVATINQTGHKLLTPPQTANTRIGVFMNMVDQGMAVYDGVMLGMRVIRNIRRIFNKKR